MSLNRSVENEIVRSTFLDGKKPNEIANNLRISAIKVRSYLISAQLDDKILVSNQYIDLYNVEAIDEC